MKRDSKATKSLVARVNRLEVTGRRLERWDGVGLLPPPGISEDALVAHVVALADAAAQGREPDIVSLILAARGFGCARMPDALARAYSAADAAALSATVAGVEPQPEIDPTTDEGSWQAEKEASLLEALVQSGVGPAPLIEMAREMLTDAVVNAAKRPMPEDPILPNAGPENPDGTPIMDRPEQVVHTTLVHLRMILSGARPTTYAAITHAAGAETDTLTPGEEGALNLFDGADEVVRGLMANLSALPVEVLAFGAQAMRLMLKATGIEDLIGGTERADQLAGMLAPAGIAFAPLLFHVFGEADLLPSEPVPEIPTDQEKSLDSPSDQGKIEAHT